MAQAIFRTVDNSQLDPAKNRLMYKSGDIITIVEDSHQWSEIESKLVWVANGKDAALWVPQFFILRVADATVADLEYLLEQAGDWVPEVGDPDDPDPEAYTPGHYVNNANRKRRKYWVDFQSMYDSQNNPTQTVLDRDMEFTVTIGMVNSYFGIKPGG